MEGSLESGGTHDGGVESAPNVPGSALPWRGDFGVLLLPVKKRRVDLLNFLDHVRMISGLEATVQKNRKPRVTSFGRGSGNVVTCMIFEANVAFNYSQTMPSSRMSEEAIVAREQGWGLVCVKQHGCSSFTAGARARCRPVITAVRNSPARQEQALAGPRTQMGPPL